MGGNFDFADLAADFLMGSQFVLGCDHDIRDFIQNCQSVAPPTHDGLTNIIKRNTTTDNLDSGVNSFARNVYSGPQINAL